MKIMTDNTLSIVDRLPRELLDEQLVSLGLTPVEARAITSLLHPEAVYAVLAKEELLHRAGEASRA
jgi:hypothetical protein